MELVSAYSTVSSLSFLFYGLSSKQHIIRLSLTNKKRGARKRKKRRKKAENENKIHRSPIKTTSV